MRADSFPEYTEECPIGVFETRFCVTKEQTDAKGFMGPGNLAREMNKITFAQFGQYGIRFEQFQKAGKLWVMCWNSMNIRRLPKEKEKICLRIWAGRGKGILYIRNYTFYTTDGEPLVSAVASFTFMDQITRKCTIPLKEINKIPIVSIKGEMPLSASHILLPDVWKDSKMHRVNEAEIDENGHLNNAYYLDFIDELPESERFHDRIPEHIWIRYNKEILVGQDVVLQSNKQNHELFIRGIREERSVFLLKISYKTQ